MGQIKSAHHHALDIDRGGCHHIRGLFVVRYFSMHAHRLCLETARSQCQGEVSAILRTTLHGICALYYHGLSRHAVPLPPILHDAGSRVELSNKAVHLYAVRFGCLVSVATSRYLDNTLIVEFRASLANFIRLAALVKLKASADPLCRSLYIFLYCSDS